MAQTAGNGRITIQGVRRSFSSPYKEIIFGLSISWALFQLAVAIWPVATPVMKAVHLGMGLILGLLIFPVVPSSKPGLFKMSLAIDLASVLAAVITGGYIVLFQEEIASHMGIPSGAEIILGTILLVLAIDVARRIIGPAISLMCLASILYAYFGNYIPGSFGNSGFDWSQIIGQMYISSEGLYGIPIDVSASFVFLFILFGAFLELSGAGDFFIRLALSLFGRLRGGPAKSAVMASTFMGMVSGSAVANVAVTGSFTIPLMKKAGYRSHIAAAVEAAASSGGQFMPPVMGAAAFIIPSIIGVTYIDVVKSALIPGLLFFLSIFIMVDLEARRTNLQSMPRSELPSFLKVMKEDFHLIIPIAVLVFFLAVQRSSPIIASFAAIISVILASGLKRRSRMSVGAILNALAKGAAGALPVVAACAAGGVVIGNIMLTGIGLSLSTLLVDLAGGSLGVLLALTMVSSLILGMGLTTTACYIILAVLVAPALVKVGISPMAAHLFIFYFGVISAITPPVALAAYTAAGISGSDPMKSGLHSFRIGLAAFILPYMFVLGPSLILEGSWLRVIISVPTALIGIGLLAISLQGYLMAPLSMLGRAWFFGCSLLLVYPDWHSDLLGLLAAGAGLAFQFRKIRRLRAGTESVSETQIGS